MKLLHVISSMNPRRGGPCQGVRNLAPRVSGLGNTVEVVCLDDPQSEYLEGEMVSIHPLGQAIGRWCYQPALRPWLEANLHRFDAVILNGLWHYFGFTMSRLANRPGTPPYFVFPHGMLDPWFQRARDRRLKAIRNWFYWKIIEHKVISNAEAIFFTCAEEMRLAQGTFSPYQPKNQINVGYGISPPPQFTGGMMEVFRQKCPEVTDRAYLLFLGRVDSKKGVDLLIQAYALVYGANAKLKRKAPCLVIAGPGLDTEYGQSMQALAASSCPPNSVFFPGMLSGDAKWGALYDSEAFVLPSHQENFGIAVAEALACGKPVLISDQINIWKEIREDKAGLIEKDTLEGTRLLLRGWEKLSPKEKITMSRDARSSFENRFGVAFSAQNLIANITELTTRSKEERSLAHVVPG